MEIIGDIVFDPASRRVFRGDQEVRLSPKAAAVLLVLLESPGSVCSRDALLERAWPKTYTGEEVLTHAIAELRRAFGDDFRNPRFFATVHKSGYRLLAPVRHGERAPIARATEKSEPRCGAELSLDDYAAYLSACEFLEQGGRENTETADARLSALVERHPQFALARVGRAKARAFLGAFYEPNIHTLEAALADCDSARRLEPRSAEAAAWEGFLFAALGASDKSVRSFGAAIELAPELADTHRMLGRVALARGELGPACVFYERSAQLSGDDYASLLTAGLVRRSLGDAQRARRDFGEALGRITTRLGTSPDDLQALRGRVRCILHLGNIDEAAPLLAAVAKLPGNNHFNLACLHAVAGDADHALDALEEGFERGRRPWSWLERHPDLDGVRGRSRYKQIASALPA